MNTHVARVAVLAIAVACAGVGAVPASALSPTDSGPPAVVDVDDRTASTDADLADPAQVDPAVPDSAPTDPAQEEPEPPVPSAPDPAPEPADPTPAPPDRSTDADPDSGSDADPAADPDGTSPDGAADADGSAAADADPSTGTDPAPADADVAPAADAAADLLALTVNPCPGGTTVFVDASNAVDLGWLIRGPGGGSFSYTADGLAMTIDGGEKVDGYVRFSMDSSYACEPTMSVAGAAASSVGLNLFPGYPDIGYAVVQTPAFAPNWVSDHNYEAGDLRPGDAYLNDAPLGNYFDPGTLVVRSVGFAFGTAPDGSPSESATLQSITIGDTTYQFAATPVTPDAPTFVDAQCGVDGAVTIPTQTGVTYEVGGTPVTGTVQVPPGTGVKVEAVAQRGYDIVSSVTSSWTFTATTPTDCPIILPMCSPTTTVTVTPSTLQGWSLTTDGDGSYTFTPDGLVISGSGAGVGGKVRGTVTLPQPLTSVATACEPYLTYTQMTVGGPTAEFAMQLLPTSGTPEANAVNHEEPSVYDAPGYRQWWSTVDYRVGSDPVWGGGYPSLAALGEYLNQGTTFTVGGFSLGRLSASQAFTELRLESVTVGSTRYVFAAESIVTPVAPTYTDVACPGLDTVTIPTVPGLVYTNAADGSTLSGTVTIPDGSSLMVTASAMPGYVLDGSAASWTFVAQPTGGCPAAAAGPASTAPSGRGGSTGGSLSATGTDSSVPSAVLGSVVVVAGALMLLAHSAWRRRATR